MRIQVKIRVRILVRSSVKDSSKDSGKDPLLLAGPWALQGNLGGLLRRLGGGPQEVCPLGPECGAHKPPQHVPTNSDAYVFYNEFGTGNSGHATENHP